jgi:hypothetical protein
MKILHALRVKNLRITVGDYPDRWLMYNDDSFTVYQRKGETVSIIANTRNEDDAVDLLLGNAISSTEYELSSDPNRGNADWDEVDDWDEDWEWDDE